MCATGTEIYLLTSVKEDFQYRFHEIHVDLVIFCELGKVL
jgi:hypothetical protein